ncbi:CotH kinase family protein [Paenibacillus sp. WLX1005]|uniref:CotH kinase family protein n=1 Tax=Paenibacillus sp. WLX1005 TaxID=3243766 RepID=UPI0039844273
MSNKPWSRLSVLALLLLLTGCSIPSGWMPWDLHDNRSDRQQSAYAAGKLADNSAVYDSDPQNVITNLYVTIMHQNLDRKTPYSWRDLNGINQPQDDDGRSLDAIFQEGDDTGPVHGMFGYSDYQVNSSISLRGTDSVKSAQKSYKIKLNGQAGAWRDQSTINLVKSVGDLTRLRNKLSFDYIRSLPDMVSMRTSFVRLHVKDLSRDDAVDEFTDYGLYTQIEQPNKAFLRAHGLDSSGSLYKAENFTFDRSPNALKLEDDPAFDKSKFQDVLQIKGSRDHQKLLNMLDELNGATEEQWDAVFHQHFDENNFLTWLATNILMDQSKAASDNYLLYSPTESDKWFFIPWDYDDAWGRTPTKERAPWQHGLAAYWQNRLVQQYFHEPGHVQQLQDKLDELRKIITPEQTKQTIAAYRKVIDPVLEQSGDPGYLPGTLDDRNAELQTLPDMSEQSAQAFVQGLQAPMPFSLHEPQTRNGALHLSWDASYDLQHEPLTYKLTISRSPAMRQPLMQIDTGSNTEAEIESLESGRYFWTVTATDKSGHTAIPYDVYTDIDDIVYYGVRQWYVQ